MDSAGVQTYLSYENNMVLNCYYLWKEGTKLLKFQEGYRSTEITEV